MKRSLDRMLELTVPFLFPLFLYQRDLKFGMATSKLLGRLGRFIPHQLGSYKSRLKDLG